ncbi:MAG: MotA/TolQ/ExbB proton channel family protein [Magnetococcales bacterium]|nr:MotA/TolQ/ExbB proton channel family protein [Magnetococcales bacterium]NGZ27115.1 MotA/TolQ/ExbB proton channel family protein [Magnetococcales bacterium]
MWELLEKGGIVMIPIGFCSIVALAIIFERLWSLRQNQILPATLLRQVDDLLESNQLRHADESVRHNALQRAQALCRDSQSAFGNILWVVISHLGQRRPILKEMVEEAGRQEVNFMERYLGLLGTIASISPLLGLLGTVLGMMKIFTAIAEGGIGNPTALAGGIYEALITTVAGLVVAIPTLAMHRFLESKITHYVAELEQHAIRVVDHIKSGH